MRALKRLIALAIAVPALAAHADSCGPADLNGDGLVDFTDYLDFLTLFDAGDPRVDYTGDGQVDFSDYLEFLNLFEAGCVPACSPAGVELACVPVPAHPFANFVDAFYSAAPISIAVDPFKSADLVGKATRIYVTANQSWSAGMTLADVRPGGFQMFTWGPSLGANIIALAGTASLPADAGEDVGVAYDIVIDENANGVFDGCDKVDGAGSSGGFYKFSDITQPNPGTAITQIDTVSLPLGRVQQGFEDQRWYYPADIAARGRLPLVVISHGAGHQYTWYDHLGRHLASYGMIAISIENNIGVITQGAQCTLDHTNSIVALQSTLAGGVLNGHIDQTEIYLIGHSRGGEAVAFAWPLLDTSYTPMFGRPKVISSADVKYVQAIAPVNSLYVTPPYSGAMTADFMLLYGSADGDVCGCSSFALSWSFAVFERALARRNSAYIQGADHNVFNCCGPRDFSGPPATELGRIEAQKLQKALTLASILHYRKANVACGEMLWRQYETFKPGATLATAVVDYEFRDAGPGRKFVIDDFQSAPDLGVSSSGGTVAATVGNLFEGRMRDPDIFGWSASEPMNGMTRSSASGDAACLVFDYDAAAPSRSLMFDVVPDGRDTTPYQYLSFRACQQTDHPFTKAVRADQVFEVELEDGMGHASRVRIDTYGGGIEEVYLRDLFGWQNEFETIRIRLADFTAGGRAVDLTDVVKVRLLFGSDHGTNQGRLALDDLEFVK